MFHFLLIALAVGSPFLLVQKAYAKYQVEEIIEKRSQGQGYGTIARALGLSRAMVQQEELTAA